MARVAPLTLAFTLFTLSAYAHPGRTDASGGHYNRKTGEYHYHNGGRSTAPTPPPRPVVAPQSLQPVDGAAPMSVKPTRPASKVAEPERINWHDIEGNLIAYGHRAAAMDRMGWQVWIRTKDGSSITVPLDKLSVADRAYALAKSKESEFKRNRRTWTSANENYTVNAKALMIDVDAVRLRRHHDKKLIAVPLVKLCDDDRQYIDRLQVAAEPPGSRRSVGENPFAVDGDDEPVSERRSTGVVLAATPLTEGRGDASAAPAQLTHWLNPSTGVRHNSSCRWYANTKGGRKCSAEDGRPCGQCGG